MKQICNLLNTIKSKDKSNINISDYHCIISRKNRISGIILSKNILFINSKFLYSFRAHWNNLEFLRPLKLLQIKDEIDKKYLEDYFNFNNDNPYAVINVLNIIKTGKKVKNLTQFPPINFKESNIDRKVKLNQLLQKIKFADQIFVYDPKSFIHKTIRFIDQVPFSHVGIIGRNNEVYEMTTEGEQKTPFINRFKDTKDHIAIYRLNDIVFLEENKQQMDEYLEYYTQHKRKFDYWGLFLIFLRKRLHFHFQKKLPTIADALYQNRLELIGYL